MSLPLKLFQLQKIDSQLDQAKFKLSEIEIELNEHSAINTALNRVNNLENSLKTSQKKLQLAEQDLQTQRLKIEQNESTLYDGTITNPKELQDLHDEVISLKKHLRTLEDRVLNSMLEVEEIDIQRQTSLQEYEKVLSSAGEKDETLIIEKNKILNEIERLKKERSVFANSITEPILQQYNQLRQLKRGVAVAQVIDRTCSACGSTLSASLLQSAFSMNQLCFCDTCGRILYGGK